MNFEGLVKGGLGRLPIPPEHTLEAQPRRPLIASFDRMDLVLSFQPAQLTTGGALVQGFLDAIPAHDQSVRAIEEQISKIELLKEKFRSSSRLFRNLDSAWNVIMTSPADFYEFLDLQRELCTALYPNAMAQAIAQAERKQQNSSVQDDESAKRNTRKGGPGMWMVLPPQLERLIGRKRGLQDVEAAIAEQEDPDRRGELQSRFDRYLTLFSSCTRLKVVYDAFCRARDARDSTLAAIREAETELLNLKEIEKCCALAISDDHILADRLGKPLAEVFPNVHIGYVLASINGSDVETMPYDDVLNAIRLAKSPHHAIFRRYDWRYNPYRAQWFSLAELRELGVCVEDPTLRSASFLNTTQSGDKSNLLQMLLEGDDPNTKDVSTGLTALGIAAAYQHEDIVRLLHRAGAKVDERDNNSLTPLLYCIQRGIESSARLLLELGADRRVKDRNGRGALYYALYSGNIRMVRWFLSRELRDVPVEPLWGFTPLHVVANNGDLRLAEFLISFGCSIYRFDRRHRSPENVAKESGQVVIEELLRKQRLSAPAQCVFKKDIPPHEVILPGDKERGIPARRLDSRVYEYFDIWIGDQSAFQPQFCTEVGFTHIIYLRTQSALPPISQWLRRDRDIQFLHYHIPPPGEAPSDPSRPSTTMMWNVGLPALENMDSSSSPDSRPNSTLSSRGKSGNSPPRSRQSRSRPTSNPFPSDSDLNSNSKNDEIFGKTAQSAFGEFVDVDGGDNWDGLEGHIPMIVSFIKNEKAHMNEMAQFHIQRIREKDSSAVALVSKRHNRDDKSGEVSSTDEEDVENNHSQTESWRRNAEKSSSGPREGDISVGIRLLICDDTGMSLSPALSATLLLLIEEIRIATSHESFREFRPSVDIGPAVSQGLVRLQQRFDDKVLKRMNARMRTTTAISIAF